MEKVLPLQTLNLKEVMDKVLKDFLIRFGSLKQGVHEFSFEVTNAFFDCFEYSEVKKGSLNVDVSLDKQSTLLILHFSIEGSVELSCDRCNKLYEQPLLANERLIVKFGDETYDSTEEILVLPHAEYEMNISNFVYEFIILNLPVQRLHPDGECDETIVGYIEEGEFEEDTQEQEEPIDPRWEALKELKNKNK